MYARLSRAAPLPAALAVLAASRVAPADPSPALDRFSVSGGAFDDYRIVAEASGIKKNGGRINGDLYGGALGVERFPWKSVGLVADCGVSTIKRNYDGDNSANLKIRLTGPSAYVKLRF